MELQSVGSNTLGQAGLAGHREKAPHLAWGARMALKGGKDLKHRV